MPVMLIIDRPIIITLHTVQSMWDVVVDMG